MNDETTRDGDVPRMTEVQWAEGEALRVAFEGGGLHVLFDEAAKLVKDNYLAVRGRSKVTGEEFECVIQRLAPGTITPAEKAAVLSERLRTIEDSARHERAAMAVREERLRRVVEELVETLVWAMVHGRLGYVARNKANSAHCDRIDAAQALLTRAREALEETR